MTASTTYSDKGKILVLLAVFLFCIKVANAQSSNNIIAKINYDVCSVNYNFTIDTAPASMPSDYYDYCECTQGLVSHAPYSFEEYYRSPFSAKKPNAYLLCSIVSLDSVNRSKEDSMLYWLHTTIAVQEIFFSPYFLDYGIPPLDEGAGEDLSTISRLYYDILEQNNAKKKRLPTLKSIDICVFPDEIATLRAGMSRSHTNLFLLSVNKNMSRAYQFFQNGEYDLSSLYTKTQYDKYLEKLYWEYITREGAVGNGHP